MNYGAPLAMEYYLIVRVSFQTKAPLSSNRISDTKETLKIEVQGQVLYNDNLLGDPASFNNLVFKLPFHSNGSQLNVLITYNAPEGVNVNTPTTYQTVF